MTQVLQHDYGKGRVTLVEIRAAIKAVKADKPPQAEAGVKSGSKVSNPTAAAQSRKGA